MTGEPIPGQPHPNEQFDGARILLKVPRAHTKALKLMLESNNLFDRYHGISAEPDESTHGPRMRVPTLVPCMQLDGSQMTTTVENTKLLLDLNLNQISTDITYASWNPFSPPTSPRQPAVREQNPLRRALREALEGPGEVSAFIQSLNLGAADLIRAFPESYSIYPPLLLLSRASLHDLWPRLITQHAASLTPLWHHLATSLACTHVALNSPIPPSNASSSPHARDAENILRSPVNLTPLHGSLGPRPTRQTLTEPTPDDFAAALWVSVTQNGIRQTWAPAYTMFSRGNVKEKARILRLTGWDDDVYDLQEEWRKEGRPEREPEEEEEEGPAPPRPTALDMYAGIGYFAFSYRRALARPVLCFELNPWSVEGLRRGCALNNWHAAVFAAPALPALHAPAHEWDTWRAGAVRGDEDLLIFAVSNVFAERVVACLRACVPPVRHVNLGLLPVSRPSWGGAARAVDRALGGWVRAHENVGVADLEARTGEVAREFQRLVDESRGAGEPERVVRVEHVEKVKMYAPGVVHAVFDVYIPGTQTHGRGADSK